MDRAIYDFEQINKWYLLYGILVTVRPKSNAVLPDYSLSDTGTPCCPHEPLDCILTERITHTYTIVLHQIVYMSMIVNDSLRYQ